MSLQDEFDKFLQERGINQNLAYFVPEYAEFKEQKVSAAMLGSYIYPVLTMKHVSRST